MHVARLPTNQRKILIDNDLLATNITTTSADRDKILGRRANQSHVAMLLPRIGLTSGSAFMAGLLIEAGVLAIAVAVGVLADRPPFASLGADPGTLVLGIAAVAPPVVVLMALLRFRPPFLTSIESAVLTALGSWLRTAPKWQLVALAVLAGVAEEGLFRGVLQPEVAALTGTVAAVIVTGLVFGIAHAVSLGYAVYATVMGVYLGAIMAATGSIGPAIIVHAGYDAVALYLMQGRARSVSPVTAPLGHPSDLGA